MKKTLPWYLVFVISLICSLPIFAADTLRAKHRIGQPGIVWEWDHIASNWLCYLSGSTNPGSGVVAIGPMATYRGIFTAPFVAFSVDATKRHLPIKQVWVEMFNSASLGNKWRTSLDNILMIDTTKSHNLSFFGREYLLYKIDAIQSDIGPQTEIWFTEGEDIATDIGCRWEYHFTPKTKLVNYLGVTAQKPYAKKLWLELWYNF